MNGTAILSSSYGKECSYILQDDNLYGYFTVLETMQIAANLKISNVTEKQQIQIVNIIRLIKIEN